MLRGDMGMVVIHQVLKLKRNVRKMPPYGTA
jgi:hypothetical protein